MIIKNTTRPFEKKYFNHCLEWVVQIYRILQASEMLRAIVLCFVDTGNNIRESEFLINKTRMLLYLTYV